MSAYAQGTSVPVDRSRAEIEQLLRRYGADQFMNGWDGARAMIGFRVKARFVRFVLEAPDRKNFRSEQRFEAEERRRWRCLLLVMKAKLEAVHTGITTFEHEFMAHIVMPDGHTVGEHVAPKIAEAYKSGKLPDLLPKMLVASSD